AVVGEPHPGAALGEADGPALAFAGDRVSVRRIELRERHDAVEARADWPDLDLHGGPEPLVGFLLQGLAAGDAPSKHVRIVQRPPNPLARRVDPLLPGHLHSANVSFDVFCRVRRPAAGPLRTALERRGAG